MKNIRFVTRADDAGSSRSANAAIAKCIRAGFIKNVSVMAPGAFVGEAAELFASDKRACFGMHATLNAEWDRVKWAPVSALPENGGLTDENGMFLPDPKLFAETRPGVELILKEYDAQLDKLTRAGFRISYVDSHMLPEMYIPGLDEATENWAKGKGLLHHMYYYNLPPGWQELAEDSSRLLHVLRSIPDGQYFFVAHPALYGEDMLLTGNAENAAEDIAGGRSGEAKMFGKRSTKWMMRLLGIRPLRYDEATPLKRTTVQQLTEMMGA